jgi:hypothetical protein
MLLISDRTVAQGTLFCGFSIEGQVPTNYFLRAIKRSVDL